MSFSDLTHLRTAGFTYQDIIATLQVAPMLTHLTIDDIPDHPDYSAFGNVIHARLQYLEVHCLIEANAVPILNLMTFPGLLELIVRDTQIRPA